MDNQVKMVSSMLLLGQMAEMIDHHRGQGSVGRSDNMWRKSFHRLSILMREEQ